MNLQDAISSLEGSQSYGECLCKIADLVRDDRICPSVMGELVIYCHKAFLLS